WQLLQPIFVFIKAGMIKDSIQHSTLLHRKHSLRFFVNSLRSSQGNRSQPVHDASCNRKIRYWYELLASVYKYYREIFHKLKRTTIMH
ncbi:unnamed protein product, partial [Musa acuminata var. zebrina]